MLSWCQHLVIANSLFNLGKYLVIQPLNLHGIFTNNQKINRSLHRIKIVLLDQQYLILSFYWSLLQIIFHHLLQNNFILNQLWLIWFQHFRKFLWFYQSFCFLLEVLVGRKNFCLCRREHLQGTMYDQIHMRLMTQVS